MKLLDTARVALAKKIKARNPHEPVGFNNLAKKLVNKRRTIYNKYKTSEDNHFLVLEEYKRFLVGLLRRENYNNNKFCKMKLENMDKKLYVPLSKGNTKSF